MFETFFFLRLLASEMEYYSKGAYIFEKYNNFSDIPEMLSSKNQTIQPNDKKTAEDQKPLNFGFLRPRAMMYSD